MQYEYQMPTQTFKFEVVFTYEVKAYNALQAYKSIDDLSVSTGVFSSAFFPIGRKSNKDIEQTIKYHGKRDYLELFNYYSNYWGSCSIEANLITNPNDWRKAHTRINYLGVA